MPHVRRQIREAVVAAVTGLATTGSRVFASRVYPLEAADLPCLTVMTLSETSNVIGMSPSVMLERRVAFEVAAHAQALTGLDDALDQICVEVEVALAAPALAGLTNDGATLTATEFSVDGSSEQPVGRAAMRYDITYYTQENAPDVAH